MSRGNLTFPFRGKMLFPSPPTTTEQYTVLREPCAGIVSGDFLFPKTSPGNRTETMRMQYRNHPGDPVREQYRPHRRNPFLIFQISTHAGPEMAQNAVIPGLPANGRGLEGGKDKWEPKGEPGWGTGVGTGVGAARLTVRNSCGGSPEGSRIGSREGDGGAGEGGGKKGEMRTKMSTNRGKSILPLGEQMTLPHDIVLLENGVFGKSINS